MVARQLVNSGSPFEPTIGFSRAVRVGSRVLVSGTGPVFPDGECPADAGAQARRCFEIVEHALRQVGASPADVRAHAHVRHRGRARRRRRSGARCAVRRHSSRAATMVVVAGSSRGRLAELEAEAELAAELDAEA